MSVQYPYLPTLADAATPEEARDACVRAFAFGAYLLND